MVCRGVLLVMMAVSLSGCIFPCVACDSAVAIKVSVTDERGMPYRDCWVEMLDRQGPADLNKSTISEDSKFVAGFVLPGPAWVIPPSRLRVGRKESDETFTT